MMETKCEDGGAIDHNLRHVCDNTTSTMTCCAAHIAVLWDHVFHANARIHEVKRLSNAALLFVDFVSGAKHADPRWGPRSSRVVDSVLEQLIFPKLSGNGWHAPRKIDFADPIIEQGRFCRLRNSRREEVES